MGVAGAVEIGPVRPNSPPRAGKICRQPASERRNLNTRKERWLYEWKIQCSIGVGIGLVASWGECSHGKRASGVGQRWTSGSDSPMGDGDSLLPLYKSAAGKGPGAA